MASTIVVEPPLEKESDTRRTIRVRSKNNGKTTLEYGVDRENIMVELQKKLKERCDKAKKEETVNFQVISNNNKPPTSSYASVENIQKMIDSLPKLTAQKLKAIKDRNAKLEHIQLSR